MLELLKKLGLPSAVAAVVAALVTITPFIFKIDERYAKATELEEEIQKLEVKNNALSAEVAKLAGITEVLVSIASQSNAASARAAESAVRPLIAPTPVPRAAPAPVPTEPVVVTPPSLPPLEVERIDVPSAPKPGATWDEKRSTLDQAQRAVEASRRNLEQIQKY
jgi:hypothetical protein